MTGRRATIRITAVCAFFCLACFVFTARLVSLQLINRDTYAPSSAGVEFIQETAIKAQRGSICDRNGSVLVNNEYRYDLAIDYFSLPSSVKQENEVFLKLIRVARACGNEVILSADYPLTGTYPDMTYAAGEAADKVRADIISWYKRKSSISAKDLAKYLAERYDLLDDDKNLTCTPEEAALIMNLRWSMIAGKFYETGSYILAEKVGLDLITAVSESGIRGGVIKTVSTRRYAYPGYASHILGQLGRIYAEDWPGYKEKGYSMDAMVGISGCEKVFEDYLRGTDGIMVTEYDKNGYITNQYIKKEPVAGRDVWLTIDIDLQIAAEDGLKNNVEYARSKARGKLTGEDASAGAFTMVEVDTGQVLAMASYPTYDLTAYNENYETLSSAEVSPLLNRAINGLYAPGSTFKVGVAAAALENGTITPDSIIVDNGVYTYFPDYQPRCWIYTSTGLTHGSINVSSAIEVSCNGFFYELGRRLGILAMNDYCKLLGFGEATGLELGGATGILAGPAYRESNGLAAWRETDTIVAAIGQSENLFSPLQINMFISAIANGGTRYAATLLYAIRDFADDGSSTVIASPVVLSRAPLSSYNRGVLLDAMRHVVTSPNSVTIRNMLTGVPVAVGGKTGTAQVGTTKSENALFEAVAPYDNPKVAAVCVIEQGYQGSVAAYTIGKVFKVYFNK